MPDHFTESTPRFSVATPTRNSLKCLRSCIASVRRQDVPVEHLIQDGASEDGTREWLEAQAGLSWESGPDTGMYDAIGMAWGRSRGEFLSWLNADEQYEPNCLEHVARVFDDNPSADAIFGDCVLVTPEGEPLCARREIPLRRVYVVNGPLYAMSCTLFVRRRLVDRFGPPAREFRACADLDWILRLIDGGARIMHTDRILATFTLGPDNLSNWQGAAAEAEEIRMQHHALPRPLRILPLACRALEKFIKGHFRHRPTVIHWLDSDGKERVLTRTLGSRWPGPAPTATTGEETS